MASTQSCPPAVFLMGPTAVGKTDLAVHLVQALPLEIISVDSAMIYRGMDLGTAKPDGEILARAPHHLLDILDPADSYSAARFAEDARRLMDDITARGRVPLLVGGTMLYFRALDFGLDVLPEADAGLRAQIDRMAAEQGWESLHRELARVDPDAAARIHPNDPQRLQRALEVYRLTGRPLSSFQAGRLVSRLPYRMLRIGLLPADRTRLRERIATRFLRMLDLGFIAEVEALKRRGDLHPGLPSMRAVGYRQVLDHLNGKLDHDSMVTAAVTATRQLAKRQMTWLRSYPDLVLLDPEGIHPDALASLVSGHLQASPVR